MTDGPTDYTTVWTMSYPITQSTKLDAQEQGWVLCISRQGISGSSGGSFHPSVIAPDGTPYVVWSNASNGDYEIHARHRMGQCVFLSAVPKGWARL